MPGSAFLKAVYRGAFELTGAARAARRKGSGRMSAFAGRRGRGARGSGVRVFPARACTDAA
ncbi:protein of unknown function [Paraburkholderia kururiensis]